MDVLTDQPSLPHTSLRGKDLVTKVGLRSRCGDLRVAVLHQGRVVEEGTSVFAAPHGPRTRRLPASALTVSV